MAKRPANRLLWGIAAILAVALLSGIGLLGVRLRPYWVARFRGQGADLRGATLALAPLAGANLSFADLSRTNLRDANLTGADLTLADLLGANLAGADLQGAKMWALDLRDVKLTGARCDAHTRWLYRFDPVKLGAVLVK